MHVKFFHASELHVSYAKIFSHMGNSSVMHVNFYKHVNTFIITLLGTACEIQTVKTISLSAYEVKKIMAAYLKGFSG